MLAQENWKVSDNILNPSVNEKKKKIQSMGAKIL